MSDTTDDLWFLNEAESEQVSVEMKEAALEQGSDAESPPEDEEGNNTSATKDKDKEVRAPHTPFHTHPGSHTPLHTQPSTHTPAHTHSLLGTENKRKTTIDLTGNTSY